MKKLFLWVISGGCCRARCGVRRHGRFPVESDAHKAWLASGKWGVELVANLANVPAVGATVFVSATKVTGATGGPVRLIAVW
jgi:kynurenine formamidase